MAQVKATDRSRAQYANLRRRFARASQPVIITQSYLRSEAVLGTQSQINFPVLVNQNVVSINEKRLALPDVFVITSMALAIYKVASGAPVSSGILRTYPNTSVFNGTATEARNLQSLYNGFLTIRVNQTVWIDSLDVQRFYRVPVSQEGVAVSTVATTGLIQRDGYDNGDFPWYGTTPGIELSGATKNDISVTLPESIALGGTSSTNYAVFYARGFLCQNGANFNSRR